MNNEPFILGIDGSYTYLCEEAIAKAGGELFLLPAHGDKEFLDEVYRVSDGILLLGGGDIDSNHYGSVNSFNFGCNPFRDDVELSLVKSAMRDGKPILGLCRGIQVMTVASGGTLFQHVDNHWLWSGRYHRIQITSSSRLRRILGEVVPDGGETWVNSLHHQAAQTLSGGFKISAWNDVIEAIEHDEGPWIGVQFHPETMVRGNRKWMRLFEWLVESADKYRKDSEPSNTSARGRS